MATRYRLSKSLESHFMSGSRTNPLSGSESSNTIRSASFFFSRMLYTHWNRKEGRKCFIYGYISIRHMVKDHSDSERGNPLPPHRLLFLISSKGSLYASSHSRLEREIAQWVHLMKDRSDDPLHHERTLLPQIYISLPLWSLVPLYCRSSV